MLVRNIKSGIISDFSEVTAKAVIAAGICEAVNDKKPKKAVKQAKNKPVKQTYATKSVKPDEITTEVLDPEE